MSHQQCYIDPDTTNRLYENLILSIDESKLVRKIISTNDQVRKIETTSGPSKLTRLLHDEVSRMESHLTDIRMQARRHLWQ